MNWLAVLVAGAAYWVLGFVWYSLLFGKMWAAEQARYRGERPPPKGGEMAGKLVGTFICNFLSAGAIGYFMFKSGIIDMNHAVRFGVAAGVGLAGAAITISHIWESRSTKVWFIDAGYHFVGCIICAITLVCWQ